MICVVELVNVKVETMSWIWWEGLHRENPGAFGKEGQELMDGRGWMFAGPRFVAHSVSILILLRFT